MSDGFHRDTWFRHFAESTAQKLGKPSSFLTAFLLVILWGAAGPFYEFSQQWQIVINTSTTVLTFLMVFLLQSTQMRDSTAIHLKLDELLRAVTDARTNLVSLEKLPDAKLQSLREEFSQIASDAEAAASELKGAEGLAYTPGAPAFAERGGSSNPDLKQVVRAAANG